MNNSIAHSLQVIFSLDKKYHSNRLATSENMARLENAAMFTFSGEAANVTPKIRVMFMKQLPTMFPRAKSKCPFFAASILVANSGMLVPNATTVAPITTLGMPMLTAM